MHRGSRGRRLESTPFPRFSRHLVGSPIWAGLGTSLLPPEDRKIKESEDRSSLEDLLILDLQAHVRARNCSPGDSESTELGLPRALLLD
jgi:hypothetical protein